MIYVTRVFEDRATNNSPTQTFVEYHEGDRSTLHRIGLRGFAAMLLTLNTVPGTLQEWTTDAECTPHNAAHIICAALAYKALESLRPVHAHSGELLRSVYLVHEWEQRSIPAMFAETRNLLNFIIDQTQMAIQNLDAAQRSAASKSCR